MQRVWVQWSSAAAAVLASLVAAPVNAADTKGVRTVAEELDKRAETPAAPAKDKLSDSAVRVMSSFAWSILPDEVPGTDGKPVKIDKSDPTKFLIPTEDARRIIRVATRSAYAEVCELPKLEELNYKTMVRNEEARKVWTEQQMIFINFLHLFAVSYFTGNTQITEQPDQPAKNGAAPNASDAAKTPAAPAAPAVPAVPATPADTAKADDGFTPKKPTCKPEQKEKVTKAINAFAQAAPPPPEPPRPPQAVPVAPAAPPPAAAAPAPAPQSAPVAGGN